MVGSLASTLGSALLQPRFLGVSLRAPSSREALDALHSHGYACAPFEHGPPLHAGAAAWAAWDVEANQRFLRAQETYWDVKCVSPLVQKHRWRNA